MNAMPVRYRSSDEDSARWDGFSFRDGDIVVSTRSKHGTTWMQTILLLIIHGTPPWPASLGELSPWLDHLVEPLDVVLERLGAQDHRRVVKTHTPLDGVPMDPRATYVVVARHPLDAAVSLYHQGANIDRDRLRALTGASRPTSELARPPLEEWLSQWVGHAADPADELDSLDGVMHHLSDAWARRGDPNVLLMHFDDLLTDRAGQMRWLADRLQLPLPEHVMADLVKACSLDAMRQRASELAPDSQGILRDALAFFREGRSGAGSALLCGADVELYNERVALLADPALLEWLHR